jgi:hypothetical protein
MPSWRWKADKPGESNNAMKDYVEIIRGESLYTDAFQKYQIEVVMLPVRQKSTKLGDYLNDLFKIETNFNLAEALLNDGWIEVYRDNVAVIYYR